MKRILALVLVLALMTASAAFAEIPGFWNPPSVKEGQYPFGDSTASLTYWMPINGGAANFISNYDENPAIAKLQADTGIDIQFTHPTVGMEKEQFNLMMASGELPDIVEIYSESWYDGGLKQLYSDGAVIDIAPYLAEYAPQYLECINHDEMAKKQIITGENGEILGFYRMSFAGAYPYMRLIARADWLDEFGMEAPTTIAEYEAYFDAVLQNKPGVTPLALDFTLPCNELMGAFDIIPDFFVRDGKVSYYANDDGYKEYLELLNKWFEKGYLSKDTLSLTTTDITAMFDNGKLGMYVDSVDAAYVRTKDQSLKATGLPFMRKEADSVLHSEIASTPVDTSLPCVSFITSACDNVEAAVAYLNYAYTYEGCLTANWGVEGSAWTWGDDGMPKFTDLYLHNPDGMTTSNCAYALRAHLISKYTYADVICGLTDEAQVANRLKYRDDPNVDSQLRLPPISLSSDATARRTELLSNVKTYVDEMMTKFVTGAESFDHWDAYVQKVNDMGVTEAVQITQDGYDQF